MSRMQAWSLHLASLTVGLTGLIYGYMRYFAESEDPFSVVNHPMQPTVQHAHILLAPFLVFACGWMWQNHVVVRFQGGSKQHRKSGWMLGATLLPMVISGYAIQVSHQESWRLLWAWVHGVSSCVWLVFAFIHPLLPHRSQPQLHGPD